MRTLIKSTAAALVVALALAISVVSTSTAAPAFKLTAGKVKKIAQKQIAEAAPTLSVNKAKSADLATNANALGGRSLAQVKPVLAVAQNSAITAVPPGGLDVVTVSFTLAAPSTVALSSSIELLGAEADERALCNARIDGTTISLGYETTFDDINTSNEAVVSVVSGSANVAAGAHTATVNCVSLAGTVTKDDAALNVVAVPN